MIRTALALPIGLVVISTLPLVAQTTPAPAKTPDKAAAYYNFAMGHLYAEMAGSYPTRGDYSRKALEFYKKALEADPTATYLSEEITDLYIQTGQLNRAVTEAEEMLKQNPENLEARRILGRVYTRLIGEGKIDEKMLKLSTEQYQKITEKDPKDIESWLVLGRLYRTGHDSVNAEKSYKQALVLDAENAEAMVGLALIYSDLGDAKQAIAMMRRANDKDPNGRTMMLLASMYEQARDYSSAADTWQKALEIEGGNERIERAFAQDLLFSDRLDEALKVYQDLAQANPKDSQAQLRIAEIYRQKHDFVEARKSLNAAKALDGDNVEVRYDEVNLLDAEGKTDEAITTLRSVLDDTVKTEYSDAEKSRRSTLLERLGILYRSVNRNPQALAAFKELAELDPSSAPRAEVQIIETYRGAKDMPAVRREADTALKKYPKDRTVVMEHASVLADFGKSDEAAAELRAIMTGESDRETLLSIAQIYDKARRFSDEQKTLDEAEKSASTPQDKASVQFVRGAMYEKMKNYDGAESEFRKVLAAQPDNAGAMNYLGYMFAERDVRLDEALRLVNRALEIEPQSGAYLDSLGWIYYRQNRLDQAEDQLRRALAKIGNDPTVHDHLGDVLLKQGRVKDAIAQWESSLKEWDSSAPSDTDTTEITQVTRKLESARVRIAKEERR